MARAPSPILIFIRQNPRTRPNPNNQIRNLAHEIKEADCDGQGEIKPDPNHEPSRNSHSEFTEIAKEVCKITRTKPRWEQTLVSDFPSFNFSDPRFFNELLKYQENVLLSLRFFNWLRSWDGFSPDPLSLNILFNGLVEAKACSVAKDFLDYTGFKPEGASLECYVRCLCEVGLIEEALDVFDRLRGDGLFPSIATWNSVLSGFLKVRRTDLVWKLYREMMESNAEVKVDVETVRCIIQAFCDDGKVSEGYELLRQVLEDGFDPGHATYNRLISGFCKERQYGTVSLLLHTMIGKKHPPTIFTYQEVINGLGKGRKWLEGFRVFNDLKDRGYAPDRVMYTTMIRGLCKLRHLGYARKLWFEMIQKGFIPNEYAYNALIYGFSKVGNLEEARKLYKEMCDRGYRETTVSCNTMIAGLCLNGRADEARGLFEEMPQKNVVRDVITYNTLIRGFCREGKIVQSTKLLKDLLQVQGLQPSKQSFTPVIERLCQIGDIQEAKKLWNDMERRGLITTVRTQEHIIVGLCKQRFIGEGKEWLLEILKRNLKPSKSTFEILIKCLSQINSHDDALLVLDYMFRIGYTLQQRTCQSLVNNLCKENSHFVESLLGEVLVGA